MMRRSAAAAGGAAKKSNCPQYQIAPVLNSCENSFASAAFRATGVSVR